MTLQAELKQELNELLEQHADQAENVWLALAGEFPADMCDPAGWYQLMMKKRAEIDTFFQRAAAKLGRTVPATAFPPHNPN